MESYSTQKKRNYKGKLYCQWSALNCKFLLCFSLFTFQYSLLSAQSRKIDSLKNVLKTEHDDTNKVNTLNQISEKLWRRSFYDSALVYSASAKTLAEKLEYKKGDAAALRNSAIVYWYQSKYPQAMEYQEKALVINREIDNKAGIAANLSNIGNIFKDEGDLVKALDYYTQALKIDEESGNSSRETGELGNIGIIYHMQGDYPKSLDYYLRALKIAEEQGDKTEIARHMANIGNIYVDENDYPKALDYYLKSLKLDEEMGDKSDIATDLGNIGNVYSDRNDLPKALDYYTRALIMAKAIGDAKMQAVDLTSIGNIYEARHYRDTAYNYYLQALKIDQEIGSKDGMAGDYASIGNVDMKLGKFKEAEAFIKIALALNDSMGALNDVRLNELQLSMLYDTTKQYKLSLEHYKKSTALNDSIYNKDKSNAITRKEMSFQFEKKEASEKAEQDKKDAIERIVRYTLLSGIALMLIFSFFIYRGYSQKKKANAIITLQKEEVEKQKELIELQKSIVDEKNSNITASIRYASRIQHALLTTEDYIGKHLPEYFILFKPRDIVSGDFYWAFQAPPPPEGGISEPMNPPSEGSEASLFYLACCDCTGHGVPGAFMSLLNISMLNETVIERKITRPDLVLNEIRNNVIKALNPDGKSETKDGMDCSLLAFDLKNKKMQVACANNPVWIIRGSECIESTVDKMPVGIQDVEHKPFTLQNFELQKGDCVYTFTDGYADQFGGPKGKKLKYKTFQEKLSIISRQPMEKQKQELETMFEQWKGNLEQVDDVLVIGIRI
jgi:tetratricopeptide (TPR) repeat protein